jgi:hypothetical protein
MKEFISFVKDAVEMILDLLCLLIFVGLPIIAIVSALIIGVYGFFENQQCSDLAQMDSTHEYHWGLWTGCMVKTPNGYWVDADDAQMLLHFDEGNTK